MLSGGFAIQAQEHHAQRIVDTRPGRPAQIEIDDTNVLEIRLHDAPPAP